MRAARFVALSIALAAFPWLGGCKSNCRALSERVCQCITTTIERDACFANAAAQESRYPPNREQDDTCEALLQGCDCFTIATPEGKAACGFSEGES